MIMSGITGPDQCLAAVGASTAMLEPCTEAIAAGDGREVWSFEGGGKIRNGVSGKCLEVGAKQRHGVLADWQSYGVGVRRCSVGWRLHREGGVGVDGGGPAEAFGRRLVPHAVGDVCR